MITLETCKWLNLCTRYYVHNQKTLSSAEKSHHNSCWSKFSKFGYSIQEVTNQHAKLHYNIALIIIQYIQRIFHALRHPSQVDVYHLLHFVINWTKVKGLCEFIYQINSSSGRSRGWHPPFCWNIMFILPIIWSKWANNSMWTPPLFSGFFHPFWKSPDPPQL